MNQQQNKTQENAHNDNEKRNKTLIWVIRLIMYSYILFQLTQIALIDYFQISKELKTLEYKKGKFVLLVALRILIKIIDIIFIGPLTFNAVINILHCMNNSPEANDILSDIKRKII